jgi:hypothetical protein
MPTPNPNMAVLRPSAWDMGTAVRIPTMPPTYSDLIAPTIPS